MAYIRFIDDSYHILGEKYINEPKPIGEVDEIREHIKEFNNPKCICALYWTNKDLETGRDYPCPIITEEYENYLKSIGRY